MRELVDGFYSEHYKKLYSIETNPTFPNYNIYERYLVSMDTGVNAKDVQPTLMVYRTRTGSTTLTGSDISSGVKYTTDGEINPFATTQLPGKYKSTTDNVPYDIFSKALIPSITPANNFTGSGFYADVQMSTMSGKTYKKEDLRTGLVTALSYSSGGTYTIKIPSVGRNLNKLINGAVAPTPTTEYEMSRNYFDGPTSYSIGVPLGLAASGTLASVNDVAIIGLSNRYNSFTTDVNQTQKNVNVEGELNRTTLIANIKQNVATVSRGFGSSGSPKQWLKANTATPTAPIVIEDFSAFSGSDANTMNVNGELVTFVEGNTTIKCNGLPDGNTCIIDKKRALIVKNGSLYIKSNITTLNDDGTQSDGQFFLGVMNDTGLANVEVKERDVNIQSPDMSGWMFVDAKVTNIDSFLFAQGPMVSYNETDKISGKNIFYSNNTAKVSSLSNQLSIF